MNKLHKLHVASSLFILAITTFGTGFIYALSITKRLLTTGETLSFWLGFFGV